MREGSTRSQSRRLNKMADDELDIELDESCPVYQLEIAWIGADEKILNASTFDFLYEDQAVRAAEDVKSNLNDIRNQSEALRDTKTIRLIIYTTVNGEVIEEISDESIDL